MKFENNKEAFEADMMNLDLKDEVNKKIEESKG
jgi:hypothetical protein